MIDNAVTQEHTSSPGRVYALDALRGISIISMVAFHATYDLAYLYGIDIPWFTEGPLQDLWRISISWTFIALAGWMTCHSRDNFRRGMVYWASALLIWVVTSIASVDEPISYGIMYCMAGCTIAWSLLERLCPSALDRHPWALVAILLALFLSTYGVPRRLYSFDQLAWLGFPGPGFYSSDYYPLIPYVFLYLASAVAAKAWKRTGSPYPTCMLKDLLPPITWIGRHAMAVYLTHQVALIAILELLL